MAPKLDTATKRKLRSAVASFFTSRKLVVPVPDKWIKSDNIADQRSDFYARVFPVHSHETATSAIEYLKTYRKIRAAAHNISAWRIETQATEGETAGEPVMEERSDDDGEKGAGSMILKIMRSMNASNAVLLVSRRIEPPGDEIGPRRFVHISRVAHEALWRAGFQSGEQYKAPGGLQLTRKMKTDKKRRHGQNLNDRDILKIEQSQEDKSVLGLKKLAVFNAIRNSQGKKIT